MSEVPTGVENLYIPLAARLRDQITSSPDAQLVGQTQGQHTSTHPRTIDLLVAPTSPLYEPDALNGFMDGLVTISPVKRLPAEPHQSRKNHLILGRLCFDEVVGRRTIQTTTQTELLDKDLLEEMGIEEGEEVIERAVDITRRIWVRVYPTARLAGDVLSYERSRAEDNHFPRNQELSNSAYSFSPDRVRAMENGPAFGHRLKEGLAHFFQIEHHH